MEEKDIEQLVPKADTVLKIMCAIMNDEEDINEYESYGPAQMNEIFNSINARFPETKLLSFDPMYTLYGQACLNGYNTFGVDFFRQLSRRVDDVQIMCYKGLVDIVTNYIIQSEHDALAKLPEEERIKIEKELVNFTGTDEEFKKKLEENNEENK